MKRVLLGLVVMAMLAVGVSAAGAQDSTGTSGRGARGAVREVITVIAEQTGLTPMDIMAQVRDGSSLAEIITANGGDVETVTASAVEAVTTAINQAVTDGWITQEQADTMLTNVETRVTDAINGEGLLDRGNRGEGRGGRDGLFGRRGERGLGMQMTLLQLAAEQTGLSLDTLWAELQSGKSLADVLVANGVDVTTFVDAAVVQATERADAAVSEGQITQEQADRMLENFRERLTDRLESSLTVEPAAST